MRGAWYNSNWQYRKSHTINNRTGAGTNYQVNITANYGAGSDSTYLVFLDSKCRTDFGDVRFTDDDETTLLYYWIQEKTDSNNAIFWVKVSDNLSSSNVDIYVYYGNAVATNISDFDNTFIFGDPFDNATLDVSRWTSVTGNPVYSISTVNNYLEVTDMDVGWYTGLGFHSKTTLSFPSQWIVEDAYGYESAYRMYIDTTYSVAQTGALILHHTDWSAPDGGISFSMLVDHWTDFDKYRVICGVGGNQDYESGDYVDHPVYRYFIMRKLYGKIAVVEGGNERVNETNSEIIDRVHLGLSKLSAFGTIRFGAFKIRKFTSPEPIHNGWGVEEEEFPNTQPNNVSMTITNLDTSTIYAEYRTYLINHTFWDNETNVEHSLANITQGNNVRMSFKWANDTDIFSILFGANVSRLYLMNCSSTINNKNYTIIIGFRLKHNATEEKDIDLKGYVEDSGGLNDTDTLQTDYAEVITALVRYPFGVSGLSMFPFILIAIFIVIVGVIIKLW